MIKGFPRPRLKVKDKSYPVPYSADESKISVVADRRVAECARDQLCLVCGDPVGDDCWALLYRSEIHAEAGPFHEKCITLTMKLCPHIAHDSSFTMVESDTEALCEAILPFWV